MGNEAALALYLSEGFKVVRRVDGKLTGNEAFAAAGYVMQRAAGEAQTAPGGKVTPHEKAPRTSKHCARAAHGPHSLLCSVPLTTTCSNETLTMTAPELEAFVAQAKALAQHFSDPADCVRVLAPLMLDLIGSAPAFLEPQHYRSDASHYARNLVYDASDGSLSLYCLVWSPGQWTPVHDHGSWGVVGVLQGVLEERNYVRLSHDRGADEGIQLVRGGVILLGRGAVTSFVPNPDHIHVTGVPMERSHAVSLHLYGRKMNDFNTYDVAAGTRQRVTVEHNES